MSYKRRRRRYKRDLSTVIKGVLISLALGMLLGFVLIQVNKTREKAENERLSNQAAGNKVTAVAGNKADNSKPADKADTNSSTSPSEEPTPTPTVTLTAEPTKGEPEVTKRIAFTFDDGPYIKLTTKFVDKLEEYGGHATWFIVGNRTESNGTEGIKYAAEKGNEIAIHGWSHERDCYYDTCSESVYKSEVSKTAEVIYTATGAYPKLMRPYGGQITSERIAASTYSVVLWSCDSEDWRHKSPQGDAGEIQKIVDNVVKHVKDGDIILMHEIYENSYEAFCQIVEQLSKQGYEFVTVSDLIGNPVAGTKYTSGR